MLRRRISRMGCIARAVGVGLWVGVALVAGCKDDSGKNAPASASASSEPAKVRLTLDWKPEPEFGGFYAAKQGGAFERNKLDVDIKPAGPGAPTWQLVAQGRTEFAT